jgi:hypothetical protein
MADRKCSCCGTYYTDETGHDLDKCIEDCKSVYIKATKNLINAGDDLQRSYECKLAILKEQLKGKTQK